MAPPRQRTTAIVDDSRSEASSGAREHKGTGSKGRKAASNSLATNSVSNREIKAAANANVTSAPALEVAQPEDLPKIPWSELPLEILHTYRHAYKLSTPSAFSKPYSQLLLSRGIGLRSPTSLAARRAQNEGDQINGSKKPLDSGKATPTTDGLHSRNLTPRLLHSSSDKHPKDQLNHIIGQGRVSKEQLALAVRKHFNSAGLAEQEAIARFLYKVREEGRGRQFRLRFQP